MVHRLILENEKRIMNRTDGLEAVKQACYMILMTERYKYEIYPWDYGIELEDLFGQPLTFVIPELERRIYEALIGDDRILDVYDFEFEFPKKGIVSATFRVSCIFGDFEAGREINI